MIDCVSDLKAHGICVCQGFQISYGLVDRSRVHSCCACYSTSGLACLINRLFWPVSALIMFLHLTMLLLEPGVRVCALAHALQIEVQLKPFPLNDCFEICRCSHGLPATHATAKQA